MTTWDPIVSAPPAPVPVTPAVALPCPAPSAEEPAQAETPPPPISTGPVGAAPLTWLARADFVVVDVETTGWHPDEAGITELAAVRVSNGQPAGEFSVLVNPGSPIPEDIVTLTGITDAMVRDAPPIGLVIPAFLTFARGCVLTAHNAPFDVGFLTAACGNSSVVWPGFSVIDTAALARSVLGESEVPDCKLATLADFFGARTQPRHRALADARATADVLLSLLGRLVSAGVRTLAEVSPAPDRRPAGAGGTLLGQSAPPAPQKS